MRTKEERQAALVRKFREVGAERLSHLNLAWLRLERDARDAETAAELLRELHTFKGEARTVGLAHVADFAHRLETLLFKARDAGFSVSRDTSDLVLHAVDTLAAMLQRSEGAEALDVSASLARLDAAVAGQVAPAAPAPAASAAPPRASVGDSAPRRTVAEQSSMRVPANRIASISDVTGELLVEQTKVSFSVAQLRQGFAEMDDLLNRPGADAASAALRELVRGFGRGLQDLEETVYRQSMHVREMDRTTRELRLVPVSTLFEPYARMVRDLSREHGKDVVLELDGGEVEADKRVLEALSEPMLHLLRNSIDHGIESPEERAAAGKPAQGRIAVSVKASGGTLQLVVSDDGRGLDPDGLRRRAVERGFLAADAAAGLSTAEALALVFLPGFTTRDEVTSVSGRGVGMDIVKQRVEQLSGRISVGGARGAGLRLEMLVPVSVSLTRALVVQVGQHLCALPSAAIESIVQVTPDAVVTLPGQTALQIDGAVVPMVRLDELLTGGCDPHARMPVGLLLGSGADRRVVQVSEPGREADLVVKPLGPPLTRMKVVSGAAVLESGGMVLMLDVPSLLARAQLGTLQRTSAAAGPQPGAPAARILLVDDSVILRNMLASIVEGLGYQVKTANDGVEGLAALEAWRPDLLITDVQMPRMDGLELMRRVRAHPRWMRLPAVILSSLGSAEDRRRGADAGASAYLVKNDLTDEAVAQLLKRFLN